MTPLAAQLATILTRARGERTRTELARSAGVTDVALTHVENGATNPTLERIGRLADTYGITIAVVDVDALLEELDTILRGKFGAADVPRRNAAKRIRAYITQETTTP